MKLLRGLAIAAALFLGISAAEAATTLCSPVVTNAGSSHNWLSSLGTNCTFGTSQPAVGDLQNVGGDTVLGNNTSSSAAPIATVAPILGIAGTSTGTIGLSNSAGGTITLQGGSGAITGYTLDFPNAAPASNGQALTATTAGVGSWTTVLAAKCTVTSKTTNYTVASADDSTCFDNSGAGGAVNFTLPASPVAGDRWNFCIVTAQAMEVVANTGETITLGNTTSASAGNLTAGNSNAVGSCVGLYFESTTAAYVTNVTGTWVVN